MKKLALIFILSFNLMAAEGSALADPILTNSGFWPYRVSLVEPYESALGSLRSGVTGVLIRVETDDNGEAQLVVDFGRNGLCRLPTDLTDIETQIEQIESGVIVKSLPNYVQMLANKFALLLPDLNYKLKLEEFEDYDGFVFVYAHALESVETLLDQVSLIPGNEKYIPLVLPQSDLDGEVLRQTIREHPITAGVLFTHLVGPYQQTLAHDVGSGDVIVVTDMDGRILERKEFPSLR